jgi:putative membrane protein
VSPDPAQEAAAARLDVDIRFLLANERTLLAWVRTALTLMLAGGGLEQFGSDLAYHSVLAVVLVGLGVVAAVLGAVRHRGADRSIRRGALPPAGRSHYAVTAAVALVGVSLLISVLLSA